MPSEKTLYAYRPEYEIEKKILELKARHQLEGPQEIMGFIVRGFFKKTDIESMKLEAKEIEIEVQQAELAYERAINHLKNVMLAIEEAQKEKENASLILEKTKEWEEKISKIKLTALDEEKRPVLEEIAKWGQQHGIKFSKLIKPLKKFPHVDGSELVESYEKAF